MVAGVGTVSSSCPWQDGVTVRPIRKPNLSGEREREREREREGEGEGGRERGKEGERGESPILINCGLLKAFTLTPSRTWLTITFTGKQREGEGEERESKHTLLRNLSNQDARCPGFNAGKPSQRERFHYILIAPTHCLLQMLNTEKPWKYVKTMQHHGDICIQHKRKVLLLNNNHVENETALALL